MARLAQTTDGRAWIGDETGFVPLAAAEPALEDILDALGRPPAELPTPAAAPASPVPPSHLTFANPIPPRRKLWGIGLNYVDHAGDLDEDAPDEPASFMKPATAATGPGGPIRLPPREISERVTAEAELAVLIGRTGTDVSPAEAQELIAGYLPVIDMTAEDILQRNPRFLTRSKSFDSFLVVGPWLRTADEIETLGEISVRTIVNDEVIAENVVANMTFSPTELVAFHSRIMTLEPGDLISTGTPGAGPIEPGDTIRAEVDQVGTVTAPVVR